MGAEPGHEPNSNQTARHKRLSLTRTQHLPNGQSADVVSDRGDVAKGRKVGQTPPLLVDGILRRRLRQSQYPWLLLSGPRPCDSSATYDLFAKQLTTSLSKLYIYDS